MAWARTPPSPSPAVAPTCPPCGPANRAHGTPPAPPPPGARSPATASPSPAASPRGARPKATPNTTPSPSWAPSPAFEVATYNRVKRPASFRLTDDTGASFILDAEGFRNASNFRAKGLPPIERPTRLLSSHVDVSVEGGSVIFRNGRGHGHGVGLSQWGAKAMADAGHDYAAILKFYYPGAQLVRLY